MFSGNLTDLSVTTQNAKYCRNLSINGIVVHVAVKCYVNVHADEMRLFSSDNMWCERVDCLSRNVFLSGEKSAGNLNP